MQGTALDKLYTFGLFFMIFAWTHGVAVAETRLLEVPDFSEFPAPEVRELSHSVSIRLLHADDYGMGIDHAGCAERIDILLDVYVERWPQFAQWADDPDWRNYWADHFGKTVYRGEIGCHFVNPIVAFLRRDGTHRTDVEPAERIPRWCGRWRDGQPTIEEDHAVAALIELAFEDAIPAAASELYVMSQSHFRSYGHLVAMNPDVLLLLMERSKVMADRRNFIFAFKLNEEDSRYGMLHMVPDARRAAVEEAAWNGDWRSILETTGPCRPRDVVMREAGLPQRRY